MASNIESDSAPAPPPFEANGPTEGHGLLSSDRTTGDDGAASASRESGARRSLDGPGNQRIAPGPRKDVIEVTILAASRAYASDNYQLSLRSIVYTELRYRLYLYHRSPVEAQEVGLARGADSHSHPAVSISPDGTV